MNIIMHTSKKKLFCSVHIIFSNIKHSHNFTFAINNGSASENQYEQDMLRYRSTMTSKISEVGQVQGIGKPL